MEYRKFGDSYVLRLDKGEEIIDSFTKFCKAENIKLASVSGLGAVNDVTVGAFNTEKFAFEGTDLTGDMEIASCVGSVTQKDGEPYMHIHLAVANPARGVFAGGHLSRGVISLTGEFIFHVIGGEVGREYDPGVGLNLFKF